MFGFRAPPPREGQWLELDGERFWLAWKPHAKARRMKLLVASTGPRLTLPPRTSEQAALAFVDQHQDWLLAQWRKQQALHLPALCRGDAASLPWLGNQIPVQWLQGRALQIIRLPEQWQIHTSARSSDSQLRAALLKTYREFGTAWFHQQMQPYLADLPKAPSALQVRPLKSLWGSLNVADVVRLDVALLLAPEPVADYVLVHELCHLLQRNHSPKFWREVQARCPDWQQHRDYLRQHGSGLKAEARRLFLHGDGVH